MKAKNLLKESLIWLIILLPIVYFFSVKSQLPQQIPIHFDIKGNADNWIDKGKFVWFLLSTTVGIYLLMLIIPLIDPKRRIKEMGNKYYSIKLALVLLMALINVFVIYVSLKNVSTRFLLVLILGLMFIILGNFLPAIKPNYFLGIRTPWTLEDADNWRKTHRFSGYLWTIAGFLLLILGLTFSDKFYALLLAIIVLIVVAPIIYSFVLYLKSKQTGKNAE